MESQSQQIDLTRIKNQEKFVLDRHAFVGWIGGRGCAKSASGSFKVMDYILHWPGARVIVIAPSYPQLQGGAMQAFFDWTPEEWIIRTSLSADKMWADVSPDGREPRRVYFRNAANPDSYRGLGGGKGLAAAWIDEIALCDSDTIRILLPALRQAGYPHQVWFTGTPKGYNWVYDQFINLDSESYMKPVKGVPQVSVYYATSYDNPFLTEEDLGRWEQQYSGRFYEQEILGKFVAFEGMVFPEFNIKTHVRPLPSDIKWVQVVGGVDTGLSDPNVCLVVGEDRPGRLWAFKEFYRPCDGKVLLQKMAQWRFDERVRRYYCDPHMKDEIATLQASGIPAVKANSSIELGIRLINNRLAPQADGKPGLYIAEYQCPNLVREMASYAHDSRHDGKEESFSDSIRKRQSDHAIDALRYAVVGALSSQMVSDVKAIRFG